MMLNLVTKIGFKYTESDILSEGDIYSVKYEDLEKFNKLPNGSKIEFEIISGYNEVVSFKVKVELK